jgi:hypothetical protein|uniref:Phage protein n=1 Tax=Siphoviridae sp. ctPJ52 TaxID=2825483 RepID=A0A8S5US28_9CAUD|nr:MAG TPA: hypothetical protein [Siphoviridae sp. ctPJ52]
MLKGTTKSGFKFEIEDKRLNNYELLEAISEVEESPLALPRVIKLLLGDSKAKALKNHVRDDEGFVSADKLSAEIMEIFESQTLKK